MLMAPILGRLGDKHGHYNIIIISMIGMAFFTILQHFVQNIGQLFVFRIIASAFIGGLLPNINAIIGSRTPLDNRGAVFGIVSSATSSGNFIGPSIGGIIASLWGIRLSVIGGLLFFSSVVCWVISKKDKFLENIS